MQAHRTLNLTGLSRRMAWLVWFGVTAGALFLVALTLLAAFSAPLHRAFSFVCHQIPTRSFYLSGHPLGVCTRCFGLYAGFALGALLYPLARRPINTTLPPPRFWLVLALVPTAFDFGLDVVGLLANTHFSRAATGLLLGAASAAYVIPALVELPRAWKKFFASPDNVKLGAQGKINGDAS